MFGNLPAALAVLLASVLAHPALLRGATPVPAEPQPAGELAAYASFGSAVAQQMRLGDLNWTEAQFNAFVAGMRATYVGKSYPLDEPGRRLSERVSQRIEELQARPAEVPAEMIEQYLRNARESLTLQQTDSGLLYRIVQPGEGPRPRHGDTVVVTFTATAPDGKTDLPQLAVKQLHIKVSELLPGLAEGVQMLALGSRAVLLLPPKLSFGSGPWPAGVDHGMPILFLVSLEDIIPEGTAR